MYEQAAWKMSQRSLKRTQSEMTELGSSGSASPDDTTVTCVTPLPDDTAYRSKRIKLSHEPMSTTTVSLEDDPFAAPATSITNTSSTIQSSTNTLKTTSSGTPGHDSQVLQSISLSLSKEGGIGRSQSLPSSGTAVIPSLTSLSPSKSTSLTSSSSSLSSPFGVKKSVSGMGLTLRPRPPLPQTPTSTKSLMSVRQNEIKGTPKYTLRGDQDSHDGGKANNITFRLLEAEATDLLHSIASTTMNSSSSSFGYPFTPTIAHSPFHDTSLSSSSATTPSLAPGSSSRATSILSYGHSKISALARFSTERYTGADREALDDIQYLIDGVASATAPASLDHAVSSLLQRLRDSWLRRLIRSSGAFPCIVCVLLYKLLSMYTLSIQPISTVSTTNSSSTLPTHSAHPSSSSALPTLTLPFSPSSPPAILSLLTLISAWMSDEIAGLDPSMLESGFKNKIALIAGEVENFDTNNGHELGNGSRRRDHLLTGGLVGDGIPVVLLRLLVGLAEGNEWVPKEPKEQLASGGLSSNSSDTPFREEGQGANHEMKVTGMDTPSNTDSGGITALRSKRRKGPALSTPTASTEPFGATTSGPHPTTQTDYPYLSSSSFRESSENTIEVTPDPLSIVHPKEVIPDSTEPLSVPFLALHALMQFSTSPEVGRALLLLQSDLPPSSYSLPPPSRTSLLSPPSLAPGTSRSTELLMTTSLTSNVIIMLQRELVTALSVLEPPPMYNDDYSTKASSTLALALSPSPSAPSSSHLISTPNKPSPPSSSSALIRSLTPSSPNAITNHNQVLLTPSSRNLARRSTSSAFALSPRLSQSSSNRNTLNSTSSLSSSSSASSSSSSSSSNLFSSSALPLSSSSSLAEVSASSRANSLHALSSTQPSSSSSLSSGSGSSDSFPSVSTSSTTSYTSSSSLSIEELLELDQAARTKASSACSSALSSLGLIPHFNTHPTSPMASTSPMSPTSTSSTPSTPVSIITPTRSRSQALVARALSGSGAPTPKAVGISSGSNNGTIANGITGILSPARTPKRSLSDALAALSSPRSGADASTTEMATPTKSNTPGQGQQQPMSPTSRSILSTPPHSNNLPQADSDWLAAPTPTRRSTSIPAHQSSNPVPNPINTSTHPSSSSNDPSTTSTSLPNPVAVDPIFGPSPQVDICFNTSSTSSSASSTHVSSLREWCIRVRSETHRLSLLMRTLERASAAARDPVALQAITEDITVSNSLGLQASRCLTVYGGGDDRWSEAYLPGSLLDWTSLWHSSPLSSSNDTESTPSSHPAAYALNANSPSSKNSTPSHRGDGHADPITGRSTLPSTPKSPSVPSLLPRTSSLSASQSNLTNATHEGSHGITALIEVALQIQRFWTLILLQSLAKSASILSTHVLSSAKSKVASKANTSFDSNNMLSDRSSTYEDVSDVMSKLSLVIEHAHAFISSTLRLLVNMTHADPSCCDALAYTHPWRRLSLSHLHSHPSSSISSSSSPLTRNTSSPGPSSSLPPLSPLSTAPPSLSLLSSSASPFTPRKRGGAVPSQSTSTTTMSSQAGIHQIMALMSLASDIVYLSSHSPPPFPSSVTAPPSSSSPTSSTSSLTPSVHFLTLWHALSSVPTSPYDRSSLDSSLSLLADISTSSIALLINVSERAASVKLSTDSIASNSSSTSFSSSSSSSTLSSSPTTTSATPSNSHYTIDNPSTYSPASPSSTSLNPAISSKDGALSSSQSNGVDTSPVLMKVLSSSYIDTLLPLSLSRFQILTRDKQTMSGEEEKSDAIGKYRRIPLLQWLCVHFVRAAEYYQTALNQSQENKEGVTTKNKPSAYTTNKQASSEVKNQGSQSTPNEDEMLDLYKTDPSHTKQSLKSTLADLQLDAQVFAFYSAVLIMWLVKLAPSSIPSVVIWSDNTLSHYVEALKDFIIFQSHSSMPNETVLQSLVFLLEAAERLESKRTWLMQENLPLDHLVTSSTEADGQSATEILQSLRR